MAAERLFNAMTALRDMLEKLSAALKKKDTNQLKEISADAAREAFVHEDEELVELSLVAYSLYKLSQKHYIRRSRQWLEFTADVHETLEECGDGADPAKITHNLMERLHELSQQFGRFAQSTVEKGRLKAAAQMYAHGASLTKATQLSGAPLSQAAAYIGATKIAEKYETMSVAERMNTIRGLFG